MQEEIMLNQNQDLYQLFVDELEDMYSSENQIIKALPKLIKLTTTPELKDSLTKHLRETENHVTRIKKIFSILGKSPTEKKCEAMEGILQEGDTITQNKNKSPTLDAGIISACQKVEHYEIASYGTLRSFAKQLGLDSEVADLIQDTLDEEGAADKKLTKIADGSLFTTGVNREAAEAGRHGRK
jgi:ferritin-like metal-binding protein YciE